jgi:sugar-specific transcriptional regulator TrmB
MDIEILKDLGLSNGEIKVYSKLLELGSSKVGKVIEKTRLASSAVHQALNKLTKKGLVSYIKKGKIKHYSAAPPKELLNFVNEKKRKIEQLIPKLEIKQELANKKQEAEIFEGTRGIMAMLNLIIDESKKGDTYYFFSSDLENQKERLKKFFTKSDVKRKDAGLTTLGLASKNFKPSFKERKFIKMKYPDFPIPSDMVICSNKVALISWDDEPVGYLIKSKQLYNIYKNFFERIWNIA